MGNRARAASGAAALALALVVLASSTPVGFAGSPDGAGAAALSPPTLPPNYTDTVVASGLNTPFGMGILPDGRILYTEKAGEIGVIDNGTVKPLHTMTEVESSGSESGLFDIAVDPDWPARPYVYVHYTNQNPQSIRVSRWTFSSTGANLVIDTGSLTHWINDGPDSAFNHNGGGLAFDSKKMLVAAFGEDADRCGAQTRTAIKGKLLRMKVDSTADPTNRRTLVPSDNPFQGDTNDNAALVWVEGLRNPYQFDVDHVGDVIWVGDVGQNTWEEVDVFKPGENGGWPYFEANRVEQTSLCAGQSSIPPNVKPVYEYPRGDGQSVMGLTVYRGKNYPNDASWPPAMDGTFLFSDYYQDWLRILRKNQSTGNYELVAGVSGTNFGTGFQSMTDAEIGPDGAVYYVASETAGSVHKIAYSGGGGGNPTIITNSLPNGQVNVAYDQTLQASGGTPPYTWSIATGTLPAGLTLAASTGRITGTPTTAGTSQFTAQVQDSATKTGTKQLSITIDPAPGNAPSAPRTLGATPGQNRVTLNWQAPANDGGSAITNYIVYRDTNLLATIGNVLTYDDTAVAGGTQYCYEVSAKNAVGEGPKSNQACATPTGANATVPSPPLNLAAAASAGKVDLTWSAPTSDGGKPITGYEIYRGATANPTTLLQAVGVQLAYADTTVAAGTTYHYVVKAKNEIGLSGSSNDAQATVPSGGTNRPPQASFTFSPASPKAGDDVTFTDSSTDPDGAASIKAWKWEFGDGSTSTARSPKHAFASEGEYTVTLNVTDDKGASGETSKKVTVAKKDGGTSPPGTIFGIDQTVFLGLLIAIIVAVALVAILLAKRRKKPQPAMQPWGPPAQQSQWGQGYQQDASQQGYSHQGQWPPPGS
jgi:glucose/arabinose dehydrogenase/chitodextrinase